MKKYAILVTTYPSEDKPAELGFVHSRVLEYLRAGLIVDVLRMNSNKGHYQYDGVNVYTGNSNELLKIAKENNYEKILVHFLSEQMDPIIKEFQTIAWIHGVEALSWKRRLFNMRLSFPRYIYLNMKQLRHNREIIKNKKDLTCVFVSEWMHSIAATDLGVNIDNYHIIPNFIDNSLFEYHPKSKEQRNHILIIRSFDSRKYANDISVKVILKLANKPYFDDLHFCIYGEGKLFEKTLNPLRQFGNIEIHNHFLSHTEIANLHKQYGIFLCPTRQDAQGVSMCEAMSSGCVPITSYNTAIPEYVDTTCGYMCDNDDIDSFVRAFDDVQMGDNFESMGKRASEKMIQLCGFNSTIKKEIELINE